jgi:integrase
LNVPAPVALQKLLTEQVLRKAVLGKRAAMRKHGLVRTQATPIFTRTSKGTDAVESGTTTQFENRWKHFYSFCVLLGRYTCSLILDRDTCPDQPIPVEIDTLRLYMQYMTFGPTVELVHPDTKVPVRDVMGKLVYCTAAWNAGINLIKFRAAMLGLDTLYPELTGSVYIEKCDSCSKLTSRARSSSRTRSSQTTSAHSACDLHTDGARVRSRGSSMNAPTVKLYLKHMRNHMKDYKSKGNIQLLPSEVRRIRTALLAENTLEGLQIWTMVIMGIKLFLRISELLTIRVEDFDPELMMLQSPSCYVSALAVRIKGKGGDYSWLSIYLDNKFPELCPVRALLLYISMSGITTGYIFPQFLPGESSIQSNHDDSSTESTDDADESESTSHYPYSKFISKIKELITGTLARTMGPRDIFGTHLLRKTGYIFAIFGMLRQYAGPVRNLHDFLMSGIMDSARHACIKNVRFYSRDASTRYEWDRCKTLQTENDVPDWRSIHILDENVIRAATVASRTQQKPLPEIALVYLMKFLQLSVQVPVADAVERAFFQKQLTSATESCADLYVKERMSASDYTDYLEKKKNDRDLNETVITPPRVTPAPVATQVKKIYANPGRSALANKSVLEKIKIFSSMYQLDKDLSPSTFTASYRAFYYLKVKRVGLCLEKCFAGDFSEFSENLETLPNKGKYICCRSSLCESRA